MKLVHLALIPLAVLALFVGSGCATSAGKPRSFEVRVTVDKSLEFTSLQVDLIGANTLADLPKWTTYSVTSYWQPDNPQRRDANKITHQFGHGLPASVVLGREDPRWQEWLRSGVAHLVVMADLPGVATDQPGNADPRRLIIPLDRKLWSYGAPLEIVIQEGGIKLLTKQKPGKQN